MKKFNMFIIMTIVSVILLCGCSKNTMARKYGGSFTITLEPGDKLEMITWKDDDSLWYLTRPMREDESAETHIFKQDSGYGIFEGTVTIIEVDKE